MTDDQPAVDGRVPGAARPEAAPAPTALTAAASSPTAEESAADLARSAADVARSLGHLEQSAEEDRARERVRRRRERWFETISTLILAVSALATAWSSYQAALWDGQQSSAYSQATALRTEGSVQSAKANQTRLAHLDLLTNYVDARVGGDEELATFYRDRFPPALEAAFLPWIALDPFTNPDAPSSPFAMAQYVLVEEQRAAELTKQADATFAAGQRANDISDVYTLATVLFAAALFFSAISERFELVPARILLLVLGGVALLGGLAVALDQPVTTG